MKPSSPKPGLHPRNRFRVGYDFARLTAASPALAAWVAPNRFGSESIDFANPAAVKALNQALLLDAYDLKYWDLPPGYLCPPVPGRSDYLHHLADLLAGNEVAIAIPRGATTAILDIGVGANCIYPLLGASEYGWRFVGTEVDPVAVRWARQLVARNPALAKLIECRLQSSATECFRGMLRSGEHFAATMCNPPFHASAQAAVAGHQRKRQNLARGGAASSRGQNFGGTARELWCPGGELAFIRRMIRQSVAVRGQCRWFTTLVSRSDHLPRLESTLHEVNASDVRTIPMAQGQKQSRILAWRF